MKSLFSLGAWCLATLALANVTSAQVSSYPSHATPYWMNASDSNGAVGTGIAPPPAQHQYQATPSYTPALSGPAQQLPPPAQQIVPPAQQIVPPAQQIVPPAQQLPPPAQQLAPPAQQIVPPTQQLPPPTQQIVPHAQSGPSTIFEGSPPAERIWDGSSVMPPGYEFGATNDLGVACASPARVGGWFGGVGFLAMTRDNANKEWLSVDELNISDQVMTTWDAEMQTSLGFEASIGHYFADCTMAWQLTYWGLFPETQSHQVYAGVDTVGGLGTSRTFDGVDYAGNPVVTVFNGQDTHLLRRSYEFHNLEWNIMGAPCYYGGGPACGPGADMGCGSCGGSGCNACATPYSPLRWNWLVGLRYLQFSEGFTFASDAGDLVFDGGPDEAYYDIDIKNQMLGFQIGGVIDYCFKPRWGFRNSLKMGVYGTHITHYSRIGGSLGAATVNNVNSPWHGQDWLVNSSKDDISFLAEWDAGVTYQWARHWRARVGYRIVAVTGVAFAAEQIPTDTYTDLGDVSRIDSNGSLILHGGYAALEFSY